MKSEARYHQTQQLMCCLSDKCRYYVYNHLPCPRFTFFQAQRQKDSLADMVFTPPPAVRLLILLYVLLLEYAKNQSGMLMATMKQSRWFSIIMMIGNNLTEHHMLFYFFLNVLLLHLPSFVWNFRVDTSQSIDLLEHILHYYFALALVLLTLVPVFAHGSFSLMASTQMVLYYLYHIFHKLKASKPMPHRKRQCTLFPNLMETCIFSFTFIMLPVFWLVSQCETLADHDTIFLVDANKRQQLLQFFRKPLLSSSLFFFTDVASVLFQFIIEVLYPLLMHHTLGK